jgi:ribosomal protein L35
VAGDLQLLRPLCAFLIAPFVQALGSRVNGITAARPLQMRATPVAVVIDTTVEAKLKTRKAAAKRFKITGSGKVMCRRAGKQHLNEKMSRKHNCRLSNEKAVFAGDVRGLAHNLCQ